MPPFSDDIYEQSYTGLEASTVLLANGEVNGEVVDVWMIQVDHERVNGRQTTLHCVHWRFDPAAATLLRVADVTVSTDRGFVEPATYQEGRPRCVSFDVAVPPPPTDPGATTAPAPDGSWIEVRHDGRDYLCRRAQRAGDYDCVQDFGTEPAIVGSPDLRCTRTFGAGFECTAEGYYPSEIEGYQVERVEGARVLCRAGECWMWPAGQDPSRATVGRPDFVCDAGRCTRS
jgi:hypothetical protein